MGTVVSLGKHRKAAARKDRQRKADANALKFGRTKAQKQAETRAAARIKAQLDGKERE